MADLHRNWGLALTRRGLLEDAEEKYKIAISLEPDDADSHYRLAGIYARKNLFDQALQMCREAVRIDPDLAEAYSLMGMCLMNRGQAEQAYDVFRRSLKLDPNQPSVLTNFALELVTGRDPSLRNPAEAVRYAERARDLSGGIDPNVLATLAQVYARAGRVDDAKKVAETAASIFRKNGQDAWLVRIELQGTTKYVVRLLRLSSIH